VGKRSVLGKIVARMRTAYRSLPNNFSHRRSRTVRRREEFNSTFLAAKSHCATGAESEGFFDFHDVAEVARAIAQDQTHNSRVRFRHHSSGMGITFDQLASRMASLYGTTLIKHIWRLGFAARASLGWRSSLLAPYRQMLPVG
jgi:hypothetical protein